MHEFEFDMKAMIEMAKDDLRAFYTTYSNKLKQQLSHPFFR